MRTSSRARTAFPCPASTCSTTSMSRARVARDVEEAYLLGVVEPLLGFLPSCPSPGAARSRSTPNSSVFADHAPVAPGGSRRCGRSSDRGALGLSPVGSARKTTGASSPLAPWTVIRRTASRRPGSTAHLLDVVLARAAARARRRRRRSRGRRPRTCGPRPAP